MIDGVTTRWDKEIQGGLGGFIHPDRGLGWFLSTVEKKEPIAQFFVRGGNPGAPFHVRGKNLLHQSTSGKKI